MTTDPLPPALIVDEFDLARDSIAPLSGGHINLSFAVSSRSAGDSVLQRVNPIFPGIVNDDIDAVTRHLAAKGLVTPKLLETRSGARYIETDDGVWRLMTRVAGSTFETIDNADQAAEAGRVLGEFHAALTDFEQPLKNKRRGVHDVERHLQALQQAVATHVAHPAHARVAAIAAELGALASAAPELPTGPLRMAHGDPKISNVIFADARAVCLIDLDTISRLPLAVELGDALRSWCNPAGEDAPDARFAVDRCRAALAGYGSAVGDRLSSTEWHAIPGATLTIAIELAARFAADALNESYFGWDRTRFDSASAHNLARAGAQLALAESITAALPELTEIVVTRP